MKVCGITPNGEPVMQSRSDLIDLCACDQEAALVAEEVRVEAVIAILDGCTTAQVFEAKKVLRALLWAIRDERRTAVRAAHWNPVTKQYSNRPVYL